MRIPTGQYKAQHKHEGHQTRQNTPQEVRTSPTQARQTRKNKVTTRPPPTTESYKMTWTGMIYLFHSFTVINIIWSYIIEVSGENYYSISPSSSSGTPKSPCQRTPWLVFQSVTVTSFPERVHTVSRQERYGICVRDNFCLKDDRLSHSCHAHVTPKPIWVRDTSCFAYEKTHAQEGRGGVMVPIETLMVLKKIRSELWPNRVGNWPNLSCYHRVSIIRFLRTECTLAYTLRVCTALHPCSWCVWVTCPRRVRECLLKTELQRD